MMPFHTNRKGTRTMAHRRLWTAVFVTAVGFSVVFSACSRDERGGNTSFHRGRDLVRSGQYEEAIAPLTQYLEQHHDGEHASRAGLYLGKAHVALGDFDGAREAWGRTVRDYPGSLEEHKCRYKLAYLAFIEGDDADAYAQFSVLADNPDGPLAAEATAFRDCLDRRGEYGMALESAGTP